MRISESVSRSVSASIFEKAVTNEYIPGDKIISQIVKVRSKRGITTHLHRTDSYELT